MCVLFNFVMGCVQRMPCRLRREQNIRSNTLSRSVPFFRCKFQYSFLTRRSPTNTDFSGRFSDCIVTQFHLLIVALNQFFHWNMIISIAGKIVFSCLRPLNWKNRYEYYATSHYFAFEDVVNVVINVNYMVVLVQNLMSARNAFGVVDVFVIL